MPEQEKLDDINLLFCFLSQHYVNTGRIIEVGFCADDYFSTVSLREVGEFNHKGIDVHLSLDEAITFMGGLSGGD